MDTIIGELLEATGLELVLVDVGASKESPPVWKPLAAHAAYVGFDPDGRDFSAQGRDFARVLMVPKAVVEAGAGERAEFFFTASPYCSSTLEPDVSALDGYLLRDLFQVSGKGAVPATSLDQVFDELRLSRMDWVKADTQGIDLRIFESLPARVMDRILAVDIEPGFIDAYKGEDKFTACHTWLMGQGFWPASFDLGRTARVRPESLAFLGEAVAGMTPEQIDARLPGSPAWINARYLRPVAFLHGRPLADWIALFAIARTVNQPGFALDLALAMNEAFDDPAARTALDAARQAIAARFDQP